MRTATLTINDNGIGTLTLRLEDSEEELIERDVLGSTIVKVCNKNGDEIAGPVMLTQPDILILTMTPSEEEELKRAAAEDAAAEEALSEQETLDEDSEGGTTEPAGD